MSIASSLQVGFLYAPKIADFLVLYQMLSSSNPLSFHEIVQHANWDSRVCYKPGLRRLVC